MVDRPNSRNLIGTLALLAGLGLYGVIIAELSVRMGELPFLVEMVFYIIAGLVWLWPARALVRWMLAPGVEGDGTD
ncbi:MAG: DUF2842 domain-containing protein [Sphingomonadales bacterium]